MPALKILVGLAAFLVVLRLGFGMIRFLGTKPPPPPPPGELRRINVHYRCTVCGMEMRVTRAAEEDPEPPRHCMEEMEFVPVE